MGVKVDFQERAITASIRDLVAPARDGTHSMGLLSQLRGKLGQQIHRRYQLERAKGTPAFQAEVGVKMTRRVDCFTAHLRGRIDGLIDDGQGLTVEEVKSVSMGKSRLMRMDAGDFPDYCLQARLYALCLAQQYGDRPVNLRLVLISISDGTRRTLAVPFDEKAALEELDELLRACLAAAEAEQRRRQTMAEISGRLCFPYATPRPHQEELTASIAEGLDLQFPVLVMAPTGIGKTVCALLSGLRFALAHGRSLFFVTAKTTQQELAVRTFRDIVTASRLPAGSLTALTLRAKERMCPPGNLLCHPDLCPYLEGFAARCESAGVVQRLVHEQTYIDPDLLYEQGELLRLCPFELSLLAAAHADLVVCDYNYVYDPSVSLGMFFDETAASTPVVIIDEAHNLFDRARGYYSPFLSRAAAVELGRQAREGESVARAESSDQLSFEAVSTPLADPRLLAELADFSDRLCRHIDETLEGAVNDGAQFIEGCAPVESDSSAWNGFAEDAARLLIRYAMHNLQRRSVQRQDPIVELLRGVMKMRDATAREAAEFVPYAAASDAPHGAGIGVLCVNPAPKLEARHQNALGTVAMSATLAPFEYYRDVLGFGQLSPRNIRGHSPFPEEHRRIVIVPTVRTTYRAREQYFGAIAQLVTDIYRVRPGRYIAFFSSYRFLSRVRERLALPSAEILVQRPRSPEAKRGDMLKELREGDSPRLLLAVMGGIFAEGVDLPGEALVGAIVVGPALPQVGFEREQMRRYYDEYFGHGFAYAMLYPGMQRVIQAAGRVIRSQDDKGVIALLGRRFAEPLYAQCLPPDWYRDEPGELVSEDPVSRLAEFWAEVE